jgi:hypothetical protein
VTWGCVGASLYYVQSIVAEVRTKPQYVMAGSPDLYYLAPDLSLETPTELHVGQTRLAMETIFNRSPSRLDHQDRLALLFTPAAVDQVNDRLIRRDAKEFKENQLHQKVEIEEVTVKIEEGQGSATTVATGQLVRAGVTGDHAVNEIWAVKLFFNWERNANLGGQGLLPTLCNSVSVFSMERTFP